jgi:hypothetical protein
MDDPNYEGDMDGTIGEDMGEFPDAERPTHRSRARFPHYKPDGGTQV